MRKISRGLFACFISISSVSAFSQVVATPPCPSTMSSKQCDDFRHTRTDGYKRYWNASEKLHDDMVQARASRDAALARYQAEPSIYNQIGVETSEGRLEDTIGYSYQSDVR
jgi:hypothetical protein